MAVGASAATAADAPPGPGLLGSVTGALDSTGAAAGLSAVTDPLHNVAAHAVPASGSPSLLHDAPVLPDLVARVPDVVSAPAGTVLVPVTTLVDGVLAEVPIVQSVVPAGTVAGVTAPVVGVVDGAVGGVTGPVLEVVAPVTGIIDPVVDVVVPVPDQGVLPPVVSGPQAPTPIPVPIMPSAPADGVLPEAGAEPITPGPATPEASADGRAASGADVADADAGTLRGTAAAAPVSPAGSAGAGLPAPDQQIDVVDVALPADGGMVRAVPEVPALPAAPPSPSAAPPSSMTGAGSAAPLAALGGAFFLVLPVLGRAGRLSMSSGLPSGPSFDPGSSPD
ncbi:hypothetical protein [Arthrobacter sp. TMS1-12-1]